MQRFALVLDDSRHTLSESAVRLVRLGVDTLYAGDPDTACEIAKREPGRIGTLVVSAHLDADVIRRVHETTLGCDPEQSVGIVAAGFPPDPDERAELRALGAEWAVWTPQDESALRFVVNASLRLPRELALRNEVRVPTSLLACFELDGERQPAVAYTLSALGAFLETPHPLEREQRMKVELWLDDEPVQMMASVLHANPPTAARHPSLPLGMAILFEDMSSRDTQWLRHFVEKRAETFCV